MTHFTGKMDPHPPPDKRRRLSPPPQRFEERNEGRMSEVKQNQEGMKNMNHLNYSHHSRQNNTDGESSPISLGGNKKLKVVQSKEKMEGKEKEKESKGEEKEVLKMVDRKKTLSLQNCKDEDLTFHVTEKIGKGTHG